MNFPKLCIGQLTPQYPIVQGGMALRVSTSSLAAAVGNAGGVGVIGATGMALDELRNEIRIAREKTAGIIGVNIMYAVRQFSELARVAIEEKIDVIFTGAGFSRDIFGWGKKGGVPIVSIVSTAKLARLAERLGAAAVVVEGKEAGGHLGTDRSVSEILPEVLNAVKIPVIAAGGIINGRGVADMFKLGASGVQMATRFVLSVECSVPQSFKDLYLKATAKDVCLISSPVGMPGRALRNEFVNKLLDGTAEKPSFCDGCLKKCSRQYCLIKALDNSQKGNVQNGVVFAGQNVYKIKDILPVQEIFKNLVNEVTTTD